MNDLLPPDSARWLHVEERCRQTFRRYGYEEIRTPVLESTELFARGIGEATDVVEKEMYTFSDRGGRSLTLRPEMTASCVRAYIQHAIDKREPVTRWYYMGPMFRYERMQVGRYRQFYQIGGEVFGLAQATMEVEQLAMLVRLYRDLEIDCRLVINSVGNREDRPAYRRVLVAFFRDHLDELCAECRRRVEVNPLRVLDCKNPRCQAVIAAAPSILDYLSATSSAHFAAVQSGLRTLEVDFSVAPRLVRGLDYYTGTVFELVAAAADLGGQKTLVAGGRYDNLVESLGGPPVPAVGFSLGVERTMLSLPATLASATPRPDAFIATVGEAAAPRALAIAETLRDAGLAVELEHRAVGIKAQFRRADKLDARCVVAVGDKELAAGKATVRDMKSGEETAVAFERLAQELAVRLTS